VDVIHDASHHELVHSWDHRPHGIGQ
jgi:hypothetical protein